MNMNKKSGFTLLEIIIVIIIVGVLASLALPKFFSTVEFSKSAEALSTIGSLRQSIERYALANGNSYTGVSTANIDLDVTTAIPGQHFTYQISGPTATSYTLTATRNSYDGTTASGNIIQVVQGAAGVTKTGNGAYAGIK
jgi:prepilin-type N-terminal cleavage/methylation domain-containing protein